MLPDDPYELLGITQDASDEETKRRVANLRSNTIPTKMPTTKTQPNTSGRSRRLTKFFLTPKSVLLTSKAECQM